MTEFWIELRRGGTLVWSDVETHDWDAVQDRLDTLRANNPGLEAAAGEFDRGAISAADLDS